MSRVIKYAVLAVMLAASVLVAGNKAREEVIDVDVISMSELSMIENLEKGDFVTIKIEKDEDGVIRAIIVDDGEIYRYGEPQSLDEYVREHPELDDCLENFELYSSDPIE